MTRVIALMDVLSDPGAAREFVRPGDEPGHVVFSESLVGACAVADFAFPENGRPRLDMKSLLEHMLRFETQAAALDDFFAAAEEGPCTCGSGRKLKNCTTQS